MFAFTLIDVEPFSLLLILIFELFQFVTDTLVAMSRRQAWCCLACWACCLLAIGSVFAEETQPNLIELPESDGMPAKPGFSGQYFSKTKAAVISDSTLTVAEEKFKHILLAFVAPWCSNSRRLLPVLDSVARLTADNEEVVIAKVDGEANPKLARAFGVNGYPKIFWTTYSHRVSYTGGRNAGAMAAFVTRSTGPAVSELKIGFNMTRADALRREIRKNRLFVVGFFEKPNIKNRGRDVASFETAMDDFRHIPSTYLLVDNIRTDKEKIASQFGAQLPGIRVFRMVEDGFSSNATNFRGRLIVPSIKEFLTAETTPSIVRFSAETANRVFEKTGKRVLFIGDEFASQPLSEVAARVASARQDLATAVMIPTNSSRFLLFFNITTSQLPMVAVMHEDARAQRSLQLFHGELADNFLLRFVDEAVGEQLYSASYV